MTSTDRRFYERALLPGKCRGRHGKVLGPRNARTCTQRMRYRPELKERLEDATATPFQQVLGRMRRRPGATGRLRPSEAQAPASVHTVFFKHPITGRMVFMQSGYASRSTAREAKALVCFESFRAPAAAQVTVRHT